MFNFYGMESDNDDIELDPKVTTNDETAVDEAGSDMEVTDVSGTTEKEAEHNEVASAGGVSTGDNQDAIAMDPVAATEAYVFKRFGLSREDIEEANEQTVAEGDEIQAEVEAAADETDPAVTTVNVVAPAGGDTEIVSPVAGVADTTAPVEPIETPIETASDVAAVENLRRICSREDDEPDTSATADVEFDVKTQSNDVNFQMEDKAITIEPNADTSATVDEGSAPEEAPAEDGGEEPAEGGEEGGEAPEQQPEAGSESWMWF